MVTLRTALCSLTLLLLLRNTVSSSQCSLLGYQYLETSVLALTQEYSITCPGSYIWSGVKRIEWQFSEGVTLGAHRVLNVEEEPSLSANDFELKITNVNKAHEGIYSCKAIFDDGSESNFIPASCLCVAGRAAFTTCATAADSEGNCKVPTHLQGEVGGSVEFDGYIEYRLGGSCGVTQRVRVMFLDRVGDDTNSLFVCSNLGRFKNVNCLDRARVSVSQQGNNKYAIKLSLNNLELSDSGSYHIQVEVEDPITGRQRVTITKVFTVDVQDMPTTATAPITTATGIPGTNPNTGCSGPVPPLLLLNGEVLEAGASITFAEIAEGAQALLCVNSSGSDTPAQFLSPGQTPVHQESSSGTATVVGGSGGFYVTRGNRLLRLNNRGVSAAVSAMALEEGDYCCAGQNSNGRTCVNIRSQ